MKPRAGQPKNSQDMGEVIELWRHADALPCSPADCERTKIELQEHEERFRWLIENTSDVIAEVDIDGVIRYASPSGEWVLGYKPEEVLGRNAFALIHPDDVPRVREVFAQVLLTPGVIGPHLELRARHRDGSWCHVEAIGKSVVDGSGQPVLVFCLRDITERRRAEVALAERTRQLESLQVAGEEISRELDLASLLGLIIRSAMDLVGAEAGTVFLWDEEAQVLVPRAWHGYGEWRGEMRLRLGQGLCGTVAQRRAGLIVNDYKSSPYALPAGLEQAEITACLAEPLVCQDRLLGVISVSNHASGNQFSEQSGQTLALFAAQAAIAIENARLYGDLQRELTQRQQAEAHLRQIVRAVEQSPASVVITDNHGAIEYVNPKFTEVTGYSLQEALGKNPRILKSGELSDDEYRRLWDTITAGGEWRGEFHNKKKNGDLFWEAASISPVRNPEGAITHFVAVKEDITERKRAEQALAERSRQLEAVRAVGEEITRELDLTRLLDLIHRRAAGLVGANRGVISLWDERTETLVTRAWHGYGAWLGEVHPRSGQGVVGRVAQRREGLIVNDYRTSPYANPLFLERTDDAKVLCEPLLYHDHLLGVILLANPPSAPPFTEEDQHLLRVFAAQAAIAIENARLFEAAERAAHEARSLYDVAHSLTTSLEPAEILHLIAVKTTELLGTPHAQVVLWDETSQTLRLGVASGTEAELVKNQEFRLGEGVNGIVAQTRAPFLANDYQALPQRVPGLSHLLAVIGVPLLYRSRFLGVLTSHATQPGSAFTPEHLALLTSFADQAAVALENARLFQQEQQRRVQVEAVRVISEEITRELDLTTLLQLITRRATELVEAAGGMVRLWDEATQCLVPGVWQGVPDWLTGWSLPLGEGVAGMAALRREELIVNDFRSSPYATPEHLERTTHTAVLAGPLLYRDRLVGVILLIQEDPARRFTSGDQEILRLFAAQAAIAIENARLYEAVRQHAATLEQRIRERTHELEMARSQAEEASHHKSKFLAHMSHDLRTPLNSIIGFSELLLEQRVGPLAEKQARYLGHIHQGGRYLLALINDILDLTKVEAGKLALHPVALPVATTLEDMLVIARQLAGKKEQTVEIRIDPGLPPVLADPVRFKQICFNLLSNAIKFTPEGGTITLTARRVDWSKGRIVESPGPIDPLTTQPIDAPADWLELRVTDTGIGIRAEDLPRLFQEFTQLEATATKQHEGTGLGLALTKRLVEMHGGRIWVESPGEGQGSTFTVILPLADSNQSPGAIGQ